MTPENFPSTCDAQATVAVRDTDSKGKALFAARPIAAGEVVFEERAFVAAQLPANRAVPACEGCCKSLAPASQAMTDPARELPWATALWIRRKVTDCPGGCGARYCSPDCLEADRAVHALLCSQGDPEHPYAELCRLTERDLAKHTFPPHAPILVAKALAKQAVAKISGGDQMPEMRYMVSDAAMYGYEKTRDQVRVHELLSRLFLTRTDDVPAILESLLTMRNVQHMIGQVALNTQQIEPKSPWVVYFETVSQLKNPAFKIKTFQTLSEKGILDKDMHNVAATDVKAAGLFTLQSCANHSCSPTASVEYPLESDSIALVATQDIPEGAEITISYIDLSLPWRERNEELAAYFFECDCTRCAVKGD